MPRRDHDTAAAVRNSVAASYFRTPRIGSRGARRTVELQSALVVSAQGDGRRTATLAHAAWLLWLRVSF